MANVPVPPEISEALVDTTDVAVSTVEIEERVAATISTKMESAQLHFDN